MVDSSLLPGKAFSPRKRLAVSLFIGLLTGLVFAIIVSVILHRQHNADLNKLTEDTRAWFTRYFDDVAQSAYSVMPLLAGSCEEAIPKLTMSATFNTKVRTLVLVKGGQGYCSSGTGKTDFRVHQYVPELDTRRNYDISLVPGTFMLPQQPSLVMWSGAGIDGQGVMTTLNINLNSRLLVQPRARNEIDIALVVKNSAVTTFDTQLLAVDALPQAPARRIALNKYGATLLIFSQGWSDNERWLWVLGTLVSALIGGLLCAWFLSTRNRPGKDILDAIHRRQFWIAYQPVVESQTGRISGVEALMRWTHPVAGAVRPDVFIPVAEAHQLIIPLTRHLFTLIAEDVPRLADILPRGVKIGVNLAPSHLYSPHFRQDILDFAAAAGEHFRLIFEITERDMIKDQAVELFQWLHDNGFEIAVDDFGTGHSALIYLERFALDCLKIDRGFVSTIGVETVTSPVLEAVLALAQRLKMATVAEGVETEKQAQWLKSRGVHYLQGYFYSRPLDIPGLKSFCQQFEPSKPPLR